MPGPTVRSTIRSFSPSNAATARSRCGSCGSTGEEKAVFSVWFILRQRSLFVETYVMPAPDENRAAGLRVPPAAEPTDLRHVVLDRRGGRVYLTGEIHNHDV